MMNDAVRRVSWYIQVIYEDQRACVSAFSATRFKCKRGEKGELPSFSLGLPRATIRGRESTGGEP